ncbi:MAG: cephalosporin-C deacetylase [Microbacteriaceae bacterium]|jgi:cephalosporin-C deacetylase|nr:cephalosporin-C deacetylase [Microbacteriaceae bacterium]
MNVDLPEAELWQYRSSQNEPADFDEFWETTLAEAREHPLDVEVIPVDAGLASTDVYDLTFSGFGGDRIHAWLRLPRHRAGRLAAIVQFPGYGNGRGHALRDLLWSTAGYAHLYVDVRGTSTSATGDPVGAGPSVPGFMTRGIASPRDYFYRRVYTDAVRAVEATRTLEAVDPSRVFAAGGSQGGGIAIAVAGLVPDLAGLMVQAPFLCDFVRASTITDAFPYAELAQFFAARRDLTAQALNTLGYVDGVNHAKRATAPALFSTGLMDPITPPSTVFGAFNAYAGEKHMNVWPYNSHEAGGSEDDANAIAFARDTIAALTHKPILRTTITTPTQGEYSPTARASVLNANGAVALDNE